MLKIWRSHHHLIFNMGIPIPGKDGLYIETGTRYHAHCLHVSFWQVLHIRVILKYISDVCECVYSKISNTRCKKLQNLMILVSFCSCLCPIHWSQLLSREWRCSWTSADRQCSNYILVINIFVAYQGATYIRGLIVVILTDWPLQDVSAILSY